MLMIDLFPFLFKKTPTSSTCIGDRELRVCDGGLKRRESLNDTSFPSDVDDDALPASMDFVLSTSSTVVVVMAPAVAPPPRSNHRYVSVNITGMGRSLLLLVVVEGTTVVLLSW